MILEQAVFAITPGLETSLEAAVEQAKGVIATAKGFSSLKLLRGIERPATYLLLNEWESLQDHMDFRESQLFLRWRELIGPYFASPPAVEHFEAAVVRRVVGA